MEKVSVVVTAPMNEDVEANKEVRVFDYRINEKEEKSLVRKQDLRIVPLAASIYLLCYLDRSNIGNAKVLKASTKNDLLTETNMTSYQYNIALMVFLIAYALFEVPSNYLLKKLRPSRWIALLMFSWGAITIGLGAAQSHVSVTIVRFLLGIFEAGKESSAETLLGDHFTFKYKEGDCVY